MTTFAERRRRFHNWLSFNTLRLTIVWKANQVLKGLIALGLDANATDNGNTLALAALVNNNADALYILNPYMLTNNEIRGLLINKDGKTSTQIETAKVEEEAFEAYLAENDRLAAQKDRAAIASLGGDLVSDLGSNPGLFPAAKNKFSNGYGLLALTGISIENVQTNFTRKFGYSIKKG